MAINKEIGAGTLITAIGHTANAMMLRWQQMSPGPEAAAVYECVTMLHLLIDNIEYEVEEDANVL